MGTATTYRFKRAMQIFARYPWNLATSKAVLAEVVMNNPNAFLMACDSARDNAPAHIFESFDFRDFIESREGKHSACRLSEEDLQEAKANNRPVTRATGFAPKVVEAPEQSNAPESTPSVVAPEPPKPAPEPKKPRPAKQAKKAPHKAPNAPEKPQVSSEQATSSADTDRESEPTEMTSVRLESFDPAGRYMLSRAITQATGFNESKVQSLLDSELPVEIDSFCQAPHANKLRRALERVRGTKVSLRTTPIRTGIK